MPAITIEYGRCNNDGVCVEVCPLRLYTLEANRLRLVPNAESLCIACGHCVAACPKAALSLEGMAPEDCTPVELGLRPSSDAAEHFLMNRRSVRAYREKAVLRETLEEILDVARWAPSARNRQAIRWIVLQKPQDVRRVAELCMDWLRSSLEAVADGPNRTFWERFGMQWDNGVDMICRGAPHLIVAHAARGEGFLAQDAACAITYVELAALAQGLGTCWAGLVMRAANASPALATFLGIPESDEVYGGLLVGYPKFRYQRIPERFEAQIVWK